MKKTYSLEEVQQMLRDVVSMAFDPNPDPAFYEKLFSKYEEEMQDYIINLMLAALMARKFAKLATEK